MKYIQYIIVLLLLAMPASAQDAQELLQKGNSLYAQGHYNKAIDAYQQVLDKGLESPALYFNMGNAYFRINELPKAVLYYEKAKLLAPNDSEIQENLETVRQYTGDEIEAVPEFFLTRWRKAIVNLLPADTWGIISMVTFVALLVVAGFVVAARSVPVKRMAFSLGIILLLVSGISFSLGNARKKRVASHSSAIVFSPSVTVRSAPNQTGTRLFTLHEGTKVQIRDSTDVWYEIRIANGEVGWLKKENVSRI